MSPLFDTAPEQIHMCDVVHRPAVWKRWEHLRHGGAHWFVECAAEFLGVWFYVWCGVGSTASFVIANLTDQPTVGSLFQIGFAYAIGIALAIIICSPTSGGHFNPCVTIAQAIFRGFPWSKVPRYILAQILGSFVAALCIYLQYRDLILELEAGLIAKGTYDQINFTPNGLAGIFALYQTPGRSLGYILVNEFIIDVMLAIVIWAIQDPTAFLCPPAMAPWVVAFAYAAAIWGYAPGDMSANSARDVGTRLMALCIWGKPAAGGAYAAIAALTNIPATMIGALIYEFILTDSARVLPPAQRDFLIGHKAHADKKSSGIHHHMHGHDHHSMGSGDEEKARIEMRE
ncbi:aquaporin-like protein [Sistotremastrum niveocremeum HHB9708]|uniref:Aquaporin-like protein n=1 Tax=Sistotremastrum niveocremeum HHB9708 TaxID=1314777 RepID=A0A164NXA9_9AGAM|nr:aquaporin-like protein [Sistotremastrum niveocremeum HHB9708]